MASSLQGCAATLLLVWADSDENFFAQCANVGDAACIMKYVFIFSFCNLKSADKNQNPKKAVECFDYNLNLYENGILQLTIRP
jgi:hypothetical protein